MDTHGMVGVAVVHHGPPHRLTGRNHTGGSGGDAAGSNVIEISSLLSTSSSSSNFLQISV